MDENLQLWFNTSVVSSLLNNILVSEGHRPGAIVHFVANDNVLYYNLDMGYNQNFLILNKQVSNELKELASTLPTLWAEDRGKYHTAIGTLIGYINPIDIQAGPEKGSKPFEIKVVGTYKTKQYSFQVAPQWVAPAYFQKATDVLTELKTHVENVKIPGFEIKSVSVGHGTFGGRKKKTTRRRR